VSIAAVSIALDHDRYPDPYLREILTGVRTIAVVGASPRRERPSHGVMAYLQRRGYRTIPVNPFAAGGRINGERVYAALAEVPEPIDMVDVFRRPEAAGGSLTRRSRSAPGSCGCSGVRDDVAAPLAEAHGLKVVMNRCPAISPPRPAAALTSLRPAGAAGAGDQRPIAGPLAGGEI
jgi:uncharacterized protein